MKEYNKGYKEGYNTALKEADIYAFYPYNLILECEYDGQEYELTPNALKKCMSEHLTDRESQVIELRFRHHLTLDEVGNKFGVTRDRVRQIESKALRKLRGHLRSYQVIPYNQFIDALNRCNTLEQQYAELSRQYEERYQEPAPEPTVDGTKIEFLDLSVRSYNCLKRAKINTIGQLRELSVGDLLQIRNMGKKSAMEIRNKLERYNNESR